MGEHRFNPKVWQEDGGWWFEYTTFDGDRTEDGPFKSRDEAWTACQNELEDQLTEAEHDA